MDYQLNVAMESLKPYSLVWLRLWVADYDANLQSSQGYENKGRKTLMMSISIGGGYHRWIGLLIGAQRCGVVALLLDSGWPNSRRVALSFLCKDGVDSSLLES